jgi:SpoVK/Ycf46/Vps4 family AAA+-type ATPase
MDNVESEGRVPGGPDLTNDKTLQGPTQRRRVFDTAVLEFTLASSERRLALLREFAVKPELSTAERRQLLIAVHRYMFSQRGELPAALNELLDMLLRLANTFELRCKLLEMLPHLMEAVKREQILDQVVPVLEQLLQQMLPTRQRTAFSQDLFERVLRMLETRKLEESVIQLTTLGLIFFPFAWVLREARADYQAALRNFGSSRGDFERLIEQFPERLEYRLDRAEILQRTDEFEEALDDVEYFLDRQPDNAEALQRQADLLMHTGHALEAVKVYDKLISLEPTSAEHLVGRAKAYEQLDYFEESIKDLEHALELDPQHAEARQFRHSMQMRRQGFGMEDDLYSAYSRGDEETFLGESKVPEARFADIGGLDSVKLLIRETIEYPLKYPELSARYGKSAGGGLLFFGPPGCGKTLLARAAAGECNVRFINVNLATVLDKWVGNSEKAISMIFALARKKVPTIIFLDEVDAIGGSRANMQAGWEKKLISQLLIELDGLSSENKNVMVLGASNAPWEVDFALRRPGRLGRLVFVPPPDAAARADIFRIYLARKPFLDAHIDPVALGEATTNYSADAIRQIVENAASIPWRQAIETGEERAINQADLLQAIAETPADLAEWTKLVGRYEEFAKQSQTKSAIGFRKAGPGKPQANPG